MLVLPSDQVMRYHGLHTSRSQRFKIGQYAIWFDVTDGMESYNVSGGYDNTVIPFETYDGLMKFLENHLMIASHEYFHKISIEEKAKIDWCINHMQPKIVSKILGNFP